MTIDEILWNTKFEKDEDNEPESYYDYKEELAIELYYENKYNNRSNNL